MRRLICGFLLLLLALPAISRSVGAAGQPVLLLDVHTPIYPATAAYVERGLDSAESQALPAVILRLNTPGGDSGSMLRLVTLIRNAAVPVIVYVAPAGAQAASAGSIVTLAGHLAAMAPETIIGAASPVDAGGADLGETLYRKAVEDIKATVRSLTQNRSAEAQALAEQMVEEARAVSADEALAIGLIDVIAPDLDNLLTQVDGRAVIVNQRPVVLDTDGAAVLPFAWHFLEQAQLFLANPLIVSLLISLGTLAVITELRAPGGWVSGFVGVLCLVLAFYGLGQLPANLLGLALVGIAFVLFILEAHTHTFGVLTLTGVATLAAGFYVLFNAADAATFQRLSLAAAIGVSLPTAVLMLIILIAVARSQRARPHTGAERLVGQRGRATVDFHLEHGVYVGTVIAWGEIWRAVSAEPITLNQPIVVQALDGFTVQVKAIVPLTIA